MRSPSKPPAAPLLVDNPWGGGSAPAPQVSPTAQVSPTRPLRTSPSPPLFYAAHNLPHAAAPQAVAHGVHDPWQSPSIPALPLASHPGSPAQLLLPKPASIVDADAASPEAPDPAASSIPQASNSLAPSPTPALRSVAAKPSTTWSDIVGRTGPHIPLPVEHLQQDSIEVAVAPERGGFVFKHINYTVTSQTKSTKVLRRYSDFLWLFDIISKRYPYRLLPNLPPKKVVGADQAFIERRRRGLARFLNFVVNHPVYHKDNVVFAFLTWSSDIQNFRNGKAINIEEEVENMQLSDAMRRSIPLNVHDRVNTFQASIVHRLEHTNEQCGIVEGFMDKTHAIHVHLSDYSKLLSKISGHQDCVSTTCHSCSQISIGCMRMAEGFEDASQISKEQSELALDKLLESLRTDRDILIAFQDLMQRADRVLSTLGIDAIVKRVQHNQSRLNEMMEKAASAKDLERLSLIIGQDQREHEYQKSRAELIHFCVWHELLLLHRLKSRTSQMHRQFSKDQVRFYSRYLETWNRISDITFDLPTTGFDDT